jgi:hypothetical protein
MFFVIRSRCERVVVLNREGKENEAKGRERGML